MFVYIISKMFTGEATNTYLIKSLLGYNGHDHMIVALTSTYVITS